MDEAAEQVTTPQPKIVQVRVGSEDRSSTRVGRLQVEGAVGPLAIVVADIDAEDVFELTAAEDEQPVETLAADAAHPALDVRVRVRRLNREYG